jgi:hypothetical protein
VKENENGKEKESGVLYKNMKKSGNSTRGERMGSARVTIKSEKTKIRHI